MRRLWERLRRRAEFDRQLAELYPEPPRVQAPRTQPRPETPAAVPHFADVARQHSMCTDPPPCRYGEDCFCARGLSCTVAAEVLASFERIAARADDRAAVAHLAALRAKLGA